MTQLNKKEFWKALNQPAIKRCENCEYLEDDPQLCFLRLNGGGYACDGFSGWDWDGENE